MNVKSELLTTWEAFESLQTIWDDLLVQSDADNLFLRWDWLNCWRKTSATPISPYIVILKKDGHIVAIAPFYKQPYRLVNGLKYNALRFAGDQGIGSEYSNFIVQRDNSEPLKKQCWQALLAYKKEWDFIWLTNIEQWTTGGKNLITSLNSINELNFHQREIDFSATPLTSLNNDILPSLSKSLRTNIKQTQKYLSRQGEWQVSVTEDLSTLSDDLNTLFSLHNKRWQQAGLKGSFERRPAMASFYQQFAQHALKTGWLRLLKLEVEGEIQAMQIGYVYNNRFLAIQEGFNPDFLAGAGQVLRYFSFQKNLQEQIAEYDFLGVYSNHKRRWLAEKRQGCHVFIFPNKLKNLPFKLKKIWPTGAYLNEA
ncbi:cellulose biosynthesis protein CelD [Psychromonas sp. psych-6C06]|uniref:GNAT family N-acetyltransferase n=1 Tax=Psychromonas sp. psych-6C06 TaxID=2058089 RepID=UPI000C3448FC|nr:GNAT family N-acetyltransferase [Psychromonas sp. psych-6C06]PKF61445.1 cellulose biosynthesis protein CelD [Psychromonas sp. psych-6C06]